MDKIRRWHVEFTTISDINDVKKIRMKHLFYVR